MGEHDDGVTMIAEGPNFCAEGLTLSQVAIVEEIIRERMRQDAKWGGATHDDELRQQDWRRLLYKETDRVFQETINQDAAAYRRELLHVAAVAVAAIEALDRQSAREARGEGVTAKGEIKVIEVRQ